MPARRAMSRIETPSKPLTANSSDAASSTASRRLSWRGARAGGSAGVSAPSVSEPRAVFAASSGVWSIRGALPVRRRIRCGHDTGFRARVYQTIVWRSRCWIDRATREEDEMAESTVAPVYDPAAPVVIRDPYPALLALQRDDPAHFSPQLKAWVLTRWEDVRRALDAPEMSVDRIRPFYEGLPKLERDVLSEVVRYLTLWLVFRDPPEHTRLRKLMGRAFTLTAVEGLR